VAVGGQARAAGGGQDHTDQSRLHTARGRPLSLLIQHDAAAREFAYTAGAEQALAAVAQEGWILVSMRLSRSPTRERASAT
jgi:hypothetical protein